MIGTRIALVFFYFIVTMLAILAAPTAVVTSSEELKLERCVDHLGKATYYEPGIGACGWISGAGDYVVEIAASLYDATSPRGKNCGQWMEIVNTENGHSVNVITVGRCEGCDSESVDLSPAAFSALGQISQGVLPIKWHFYPPGDLNN